MTGPSLSFVRITAKCRTDRLQKGADDEFARTVAGARQPHRPTTAQNFVWIDQNLSVAPARTEIHRHPHRIEQRTLLVSLRDL